MQLSSAGAQAIDLKIRGAPGTGIGDTPSQSASIPYDRAAAVPVTAQTTRARDLHRSVIMAKGQEKPKTNNKPKLTVKEKKAKKKEKAAK